MTHTSPLLVVRDRLDGALLALRDVSDEVAPVRDCERSVASALRHVYVALASLGDYAAFRTAIDASLSLSRGALAALQQAPTEDPASGAVSAQLAEALGLLREMPFAPVEPPPSLPQGGVAALCVASREEPRVLDPARAVFDPVAPLPFAAPVVPIPAPAEPASAPPVASVSTADLLAKAMAGLAAFDAKARPAADDEDEDETPKKRALPRRSADAFERNNFGRATAEGRVLFEHARNCFEDLGMLGSMRRPMPEVPWGAPTTEARLLTKVDALVACGQEHYTNALRLLEDRPVPDADLTWAAVFFCGCLAGDDAADQSMRLAHSAAQDAPNMRAALVDALALAPSSALDARLRRWLADPNPSHRVIAMRALARRNAVTADEVRAGSVDEDLRVRTAAAFAVARTVDPPPLDALARLIDETSSAGVVRAALASSVFCAPAMGLATARAFTRAGRGGFADAALFVSVMGGPDEFPALLEDAAAGGSVATVLALGWYGNLDAAEYLLGRLNGPAPATKKAAAEALQRLTGVALTEENPAPEFDPEEGPFEPRFEPDPAPTVLTFERAPWAALLERYLPKARPHTRYRFGGAYTAESSLLEVERAVTQSDEREWAHYELVARAGVSAPLDRDHFVARQRRELAAIRGALGPALQRTPGAWATKAGR